MIKILICSLLALSLISCNTDGDNPNPDEENPEEIKGPDGGPVDPEKQYTLVNKTEDDEAVSVVLFKSYDKLQANDQTECAPHVLKAGECLTIKGAQFNLLQVALDKEIVCGTTAISCNPGDYEVTESGMLWWHEFLLSELTEETKSETSPSSRKNQKSAEEEAEEENNAEEEEEQEESKTCTPLECKQPETSEEENNSEEEAEEENS